MSITFGSNFLFLSILAPIGFIGLCFYFIVSKNWINLFEILWEIIEKALKVLWPVILLKIFDKCTLKGNTNYVLSNYKQKLRFFWLLTIIDTFNTFFSALVMGFISVFIMKVIYSILFVGISFLTPYKSSLRHQLKIMILFIKHIVQMLY